MINEVLPYISFFTFSQCLCAFCSSHLWRTRRSLLGRDLLAFGEESLHSLNVLSRANDDIALLSEALDLDVEDRNLPIAREASCLLDQIRYRCTLIEESKLGSHLWGGADRAKDTFVLGEYVVAVWGHAA